MRKLIAGINLTLDGYCDHTAIIPDDEVHDHYTRFLNNADTVLYGRTTYQLMQYWIPMLTNPTGIRAMDDFAVAIDRIQKIVFSNTITREDLGWESARLAVKELNEEVTELKNQSGRDILVGSPGLIVSLTNLGLIDEYQLCFHPVLAAKGTPLFKNLNERLTLKLIDTKIFKGGAIILRYEPVNITS